MFGHYPDGYLNVSSWGHGYPAGSSRYNQVLQCQAKLDIPASVGSQATIMNRPWLNGFTLMDLPEDPEAVAFVPDKEIGDVVKGKFLDILKEHQEWKKHQRA